MPKLWTDTIEAHREAVRQAALDVTAELVVHHGLRSVTMSQIADATGIGRATLYKYFADVEAVLLAWHEREIGRHLRQLEQVRDSTAEPWARLEDVLETYALISHDSHGRHDADMASLLHRAEHVARGERHLRELVRALVVDATLAGHVRDDVPADELATFCLHAVSAARGLPSKAAVRRLVDVTLAGLRRAS